MPLVLMLHLLKACYFKAKVLMLLDQGGAASKLKSAASASQPHVELEGVLRNGFPFISNCPTLLAGGFLL